jgi:hypothetical protein
VCCQVEVSATGWSLVERSPTDCGGSLCVTYKLQEWGGPGPLGRGEKAIAPNVKKKEKFGSQRKITISVKSIILLHLVMETQCVFCKVGSGILYYLDEFQAYSGCQVKRKFWDSYAQSWGAICNVELHYM